MQIEKSFGIGCFHFGIRKKAPFKYKDSDYIRELQISLSKIPNLDNLKLHYDNSLEDDVGGEPIDENLPNLKDDVGYYPQIPHLDLEFDLYIPLRVQAELCHTEEKLIHTFTERFKVRIFQSYYFPVSVVETLSPTKPNSPSKGIQIVREFLNRELAVDKSPYIRFECIGPSPFHLDCYILPKKRDTDEFWLLETVELIESGYDKVFFY